MYPQPAMFRLGLQAGQKIRSPIIRSAFQRRLTSMSSEKLTGTADNAFNRERAAVKAHAPKGSGSPKGLQSSNSDVKDWVNRQFENSVPPGSKNWGSYFFMSVILGSMVRTCSILLIRK
jgi:hypothetical protein